MTTEEQFQAAVNVIRNLPRNGKMSSNEYNQIVKQASIALCNVCFLFSDSTNR